MNFSQQDIETILARPGYGIEGQPLKPSPKGTELAREATTGQGGTSTKYHNKKTFYNGILYDSRAEAKKAQDLDLMIKAGEIDFWLRQVPFKLPGDTVYRLDFVTFKICPDCYSDHGYKVKFIEVKGKKIRLGEIKRKQTEELYGITIQVEK